MHQNGFLRKSLLTLAMVGFTGSLNAADLPESWVEGREHSIVDVCAGVSNMRFFDRLSYLRKHPECRSTRTASGYDSGQGGEYTSRDPAPSRNTPSTPAAASTPNTPNSSTTPSVADNPNTPTTPTSSGGRQPVSCDCAPPTQETIDRIGEIVGELTGNRP